MTLATAVLGTYVVVCVGLGVAALLSPTAVARVAAWPRTLGSDAGIGDVEPSVGTLPVRIMGVVVLLQGVLAGVVFAAAHLQ